MFADEKADSELYDTKLGDEKKKSSKDHSKVAVGPPTWLANLDQDDQDQLIQLLAQAISEYGSFTKDVKEDLKRKFSIKVLFFVFFFKNRFKVIVYTVQIGSFRTKASKNIIYFFSMNFNSILTSIPSKCQEFTLLYEYEKIFCKFWFI